jgi:hypothetical protein
MSRQTTMIVFSSPVQGREGEYNDWYDNTVRARSALA